MLGSGCVLAIFACWVLTDQNSTTSPLGSGTLTGCHIGLSRKTAIRVAASWESLFVYDSMLFALTLIKTYRTRRKGTLRINLLSLLLRDGAIYFALMALANLSNLLTFYLAPPYLRGGLSTFATCVSVTMLSRFTLILFESTEEALYSTTVNLETMIFVEDPRPPTSTRYSAELIGLEDVCLENYHKTDTNKG
ncbi:hypothetical protein BT96DRAFT_412320 [Gymnopus androsaceus JB14]|uniref:G-protein coupled receptors family 3 profile domain-containing protein n=1 Tax=Gymnopus androsaceus JB14 TaxID=1447944 RepID=A0A6A4I2L6_9AGAR|nr:hypothetical protein BT96DRAFT_412320 [Gymnopus androsaceus JB14]